jgi:hypothetical protein
MPTFVGNLGGHLESFAPCSPIEIVPSCSRQRQAANDTLSNLCTRSCPLVPAVNPWVLLYPSGPWKSYPLDRLLILSKKAIQCGEMQLIQEPKTWEQASGVHDYPYEKDSERSTAAAIDYCRQSFAGKMTKILQLLPVDSTLRVTSSYWRSTFPLRSGATSRTCLNKLQYRLDMKDGQEGGQ